MSQGPGKQETKLPCCIRLEGQAGGGEVVLEGGFDDVGEIDSQIDDVLRDRGSEKVD
jgi:hypothetical protein